MQAKYPHKWASAIDDDDVYKLAVSIWQQDLAGLSDEEIKTGLSALPKSWPPTSGEFRDLCEQKEPMWQHNTSSWRPFPKIESLDMSAEAKAKRKKVAKSKLAECKRILKGNRVIDTVAVSHSVVEG